METVRLEHLTIGYKSRRNHKVVTQDINASLNSACMTCLIGPNGVGNPPFYGHFPPFNLLWTEGCLFMEMMWPT